MKREQHVYGLETQYYYISILPTDLQIQYNLIKIRIYNSNNKQHSFKKLLKILCGPFFKSVLVCYGITSCFFYVLVILAMACRILAPQPGIESIPCHGSKVLTREVPNEYFFQWVKDLNRHFISLNNIYKWSIST